MKHIPMAATKRRRGNPQWGKPLRPPIRLLMSEFEMQVERFGLARDEYVASAKLKLWCDRNRNRIYIPEWLLRAWGMEVDAIFTGAT
jgi:hypothetical protein